MAHEWIVEGLKKPGKSKVGLAKAMRRSPSMVTALLSGARQLKAAEIKTIADYLEIQPPADMGLILETDPVLLPLQELKIIGEVAAGNWVEPERYVFEPVPYPVPADPRFLMEHQFLLRVKGTSVNRKAPDGSLVRCLSVFGAPRPPQHNDWVVIEREKADGSIETTVKKLVIDRDGTKQFWPDSDDPAHQEPIKPQSHKNGHDEDSVRVIAFVMDFITPATML